MRFASLLNWFLTVLIPIAISSTTYLYLYPLVHACGFPSIPLKQGSSSPAPFRLLTLADPQLEGSTSLPDPNAPLFPNIGRVLESVSRVRSIGDTKQLLDAVTAIIKEDVVGIIQAHRKRLDLLGNDYYLAHVYRAVKWWSQPTHTVVLGDLLGSQWIDDSEFDYRAWRYWSRVFPGTHLVDEQHLSAQDTGSDIEARHAYGVDWTKALINVVGNHDIGYAGDIDEKRIARFEKQFGRVNWNVSFELNRTASTLRRPTVDGMPRLDLVVLNSMNLDAPAQYQAAQDESRRCLKAQMRRPNDDTSNARTATVLLTHIPFFKEDGLCTDGPFTSYFPEEQGGGISEQNHLSAEASKTILDGFFRGDEAGPKYRAGIVLNGHDHEGCDVQHYWGEDEVQSSQSGNVSRFKDWTSTRFSGKTVDEGKLGGVREITVRSMMGSYGGNAGFLSGWYDDETAQWRFEYSSCRLGVQHIWWAVHVLDVVVFGIALAAIAVNVLAAMQPQRRSGRLYTKKNQ